MPTTRRRPLPPACPGPCAPGGRGRGVACKPAGAREPARQRCLATGRARRPQELGPGMRMPGNVARTAAGAACA
eukprot:15436404-Alexandrium_andersonii.AAC.1